MAKHVAPSPNHPVVTLDENYTTNKGKSPHLTASYILDGDKAMSNKLSATNRPLNIQPKINSGNITLKLNTAVYELVKVSLPKHLSQLG